MATLDKLYNISYAARMRKVGRGILLGVMVVCGVIYIATFCALTGAIQ